MNFITDWIFNKKAEDELPPNYKQYELDYENHFLRGAVGSCDAGHKLDRIIICMLDAGHLTPTQANRFWSFCQKTLNKVKEFHRSIPREMKPVVFELLRKDLLDRAVRLCLLHEVDQGHPLENHLRSYVVTLTSVHYLPTPSVQRMTFEQIKNDYDIESLFKNKHLNRNPELHERYLLSIIRNSRDSVASQHDAELKQHIESTKMDSVIRAFSEININ